MQNDGLKTITPFSLGLPKTGQSVKYADGDDGEYEAGWWRGRLNVNNRTRFLVKTIDGDEVVVDLATGLIWARDGERAGCNNGSKDFWIEALRYCLALNFGGYADWRLPNIKELFSIICWCVYNPAVWDSFTNVKYNDYTWTSTTRKYNTAYAKAISFSEGAITSKSKMTTGYFRAVRGGI